MEALNKEFNWTNEQVPLFHLSMKEFRSQIKLWSLPKQYKFRNQNEWR